MADVRVMKGPNGSCLWPIYEEEEKRLTEMLGVDFKTFDIGGTLVLQPPLRCQQCNKQSGFDDFVHEALTDGIHSKEFILRILNRTGSGKVPASPPHPLKCMKCNVYYRYPPNMGYANADLDAAEGAVALFGWATGHSFDWKLSTKERDQCADSDATEGKKALFGWATGHSFDWKLSTKERDQHVDPDAAQGKRALFGWATGHSFDWKRSAEDMKLAGDVDTRSTEGAVAVFGWATGESFDWTMSNKERDDLEV